MNVDELDVGNSREHERMNRTARRSKPGDEIVHQPRDVGRWWGPKDIVLTAAHDILLESVPPARAVSIDLADDHEVQRAQKSAVDVGRWVIRVLAREPNGVPIVQILQFSDI